MLATYFVDTTADNTAGICAADNAAGNFNCTLRLAIEEAEANPGADTIQIADGNYLIDPAIGSFDLENAEDTAFIGNAADATAVVIDGDNQSRVFDIFGGVGVPYSVSFQGLTIQNGVAADGSGGGGINASSDVDLSLNNVILQNNLAAENTFNPGEFSSGGGIQASGNVTIANSTLQNNSATIDGGGLDYSSNDSTKSLSISDSTFSGNTATFVGGGIYLQDVQTGATIDNVTFMNNEGPDSGGGIYSDGATIDVRNSTFTSNHATSAGSGGGGLYILGQTGTGAFRVADSNFQNNDAVDGAGGLEVVDVAGTISGGTYGNNQVTGIGNAFDQGGGGIVIIGNSSGSPPAVSIMGVTIENNSAPAAGGLALVDANVTVTDSLIQNNNATSAFIGGGGIGGTNSVAGSPLTIQRTRVLGNTTAAEAGGVGTLDLSVLISDSTIDGNVAAGGRAGGVGIIGSAQAPVLTITNSTISNNTANAEAGGIGVDQAGLQLTNVTVTGNTSQNASAGGVLYNNSNGASQSSISFSTIAGNTSLEVGSNLAAFATATMTIDDSIFADGDCAIAGGSVASAGFNIDSGSTCGFGQASDQSNTDALLGPLQDNGGPVFTRALGAGSPAIDAASSNAPATDARGVTRPLDGDGDTVAIADIGAFEAGMSAQARLTIRDVFFEESMGNALILVTLDADVGGPFTVDFSTVDGTATAPGDYQTTTGTLNFQGTAREQQSIVVPINDDAVAEADEQFQITLSNPSTSVDASDVGLVSLFDDDTAVLTVDRLTESPEDSGSVTFGITLSGDTDVAFTVDVATFDLTGEAIAGIDYTATSGTLTFAGNDGETQSLTVPIIADTNVELDEEIGVEAKNISAGTRDIVFNNFADRVDISSIGQFAPGGISANDVALFTPDPFTTIAYVADDSGLLILDVSDPTAVVQLGAFPLASPALDIDTVDVAFFSDVIYIAAGDGGLEILDVSDPANITRLGSFAVPGQQALSLARQGGTIYLGETDATSLGSLRILDASNPSNITQQGVFQGNLAAAKDVLLDGTTAYVASDQGLAVIDVSNPAIPTSLGAFASRPGTVIGIDGTTAYLGTPTGLAVLDASDAANITELDFFATTNEVTAIDVEGNTNSITDRNGVVHILDTFAQVKELGSFTVATTALGFDIEGLTAYVATGSSGLQIIEGDLVAEADLLILNDDTATLNVTDVTVNEADGNATVLVSVDHGVDGGFTVDVTTNDDTATAPDDYASTSQTLTFSGAAGQTQPFTIPIVNDGVPDDNETFFVSLSNVMPLGGVSASLIGATDTGTVTITETQVPQVDLSTSIVESADPVEVGDSFTLTVPVSNGGPDVASGVVSTTTLPPELSINNATSDFAGATVDVVGNVVTVSIPSLDSGITATLTIVATAVSPGDVTTSTTVTSGDLEVFAGDNSAAEVTTINAPPAQTATVQGHVFCDADGNGAEDSGEAVVGTTVFLDTDGDRILDAGELSTLTDSNGDYRFVNVPRSTLTVVVQVPPNCDTIPMNPGIARSVIPVGALARSIDAADLEGDGDIDLFVASDASHSLSVLRNDDGVFSLDREITLADRPQSVFAWQSPSQSPPLVGVAGVGTPDDGGSIFLINGTEELIQLDVGNGPIDVVIDDFDRNGVADVLFAAFRSSNLQLLMNGSSEPTTIGTARQVRTVTTGDVNDDGHRDIVFAGFGYPGDDASELVVRLGDGSGGFGEAIKTNPIEKLLAVKVTKLTGDPSETDTVVLALSKAGQLIVHAMENGSLAEIGTIDTGEGATALDVGDFNRDGLTDLAIANLGDQLIELYVGDGNGRFAPVTTISNVPAPSDIVVDDFDGDGVDDIAVANLYQDANLGQSGPPQFFVPSTTTILRVDVAENSVVVSDDAVTQIDFAFQSADPAIVFDVTGEGEVSSLDALRVINAMSRIAGASEHEATTLGRESTDVNGDGTTSAIDALMIINFLGRRQDAPIAGIDHLVGDDDDQEDRFATVDLVLTQLV